MSFPPIFTPESRILILGTYPSPMSRATGFYYGHPRNRFWPLMAALLGAAVPVSIQEKTALLIDNGIALWDVLDRCEIKGASDSSIQEPVPNDLQSVLREAPIQGVYANGAKAAQLYHQFMHDSAGPLFHRLPSTSPANARYDFDRLLAAWSCILEHPGHPGHAGGAVQTIKDKEE